MIELNKLSQEIFESTYQFNGETIDGLWTRVARELASAELTPEKCDIQFSEFYEALKDFKFIPGGRILSNAGTGYKGTSYINCFTEDCKVLTNIGYKKIIDIKIGDEVLTHTGNYKKVVNVMSKEVKENIDIYKSSNLINPIKVSKEHPFYQGDNKWVESKDNSKLVLLQKNIDDGELITIDICDYLTTKDYEVNDGILSKNTTYFIKNTEVTKKYYNLNRFIEINKEIAYFLGRFIGDGSTFTTSKEYEVNGFNIAFSNKEKVALNYIKSIIKNNFKVDVNINYSKEFEGMYLRKNHLFIAEFLRNSCGRYSHSKNIPDFIWKSNNEIKLKFLQGLFDADGTITKNSFKLTLNNEDLIDDIQALLLQLNIVSTKRREHINAYPDNKYYSILLSKNNMNILIKDSLKMYDDDRKKERKIKFRNSGQFKSCYYTETNDYDGEIKLITKFEKTEEFFEGKLYNLSIKDDESYVVNNVIVHNCFVSGFTGKDQDSMESILAELRRQALILKSEGGYGFCCSVLRPKGAFIEGIGSSTPGMVKFLDMWNTQSAVITQGSGMVQTIGKKRNRKGAMMTTAFCWHPDIEEFITAKQTPDRLTKFNMSVLVTDDFMQAVEKDDVWNLVFPDFSLDKEFYKENWEGDINKWQLRGGKIKIYKTIQARELYDLMMQSAYNRAEPGILFIDTINRNNNLCSIETINATNPCGKCLPHVKNWVKTVKAN